MTSPTASMTPKVTRYCTSETAKLMRGSTKKKSSKPTLSKLASTAGPRPSRSATATTHSRYTMTMLAVSRCHCSGQLSAVATAHTAAARL